MLYLSITVEMVIYSLANNVMMVTSLMEMDAAQAVRMKLQQPQQFVLQAHHILYTPDQLRR